MRYRHTKQYYEKWLKHSGLTNFDMRGKIHAVYGAYLKEHELIDYMYRMQFLAYELNSIKETC